MAIPKLLWLNRLLDPLASRPLSDQRRRCPLAPSLRRPLPPSQRRLSPRCCSLQLFPRQVSKPLLIRFGDVRVEADSQLLSKQDGSASGTPAAVPVTENSGNSFGRFLHLIQYCGFSVTSVQLVLLEAIPDCMLHVTVDELSAEAFRSREGCQLELSCRLAQGKILRRRDASERLLANFAFSLQLSIDVTSGGLNRLGLRLADPSINLYRGILDVIQEFLERWLRLLQKKHDRCWPRGSRDWRMPQFLSTIARSSTRVSRTIKGEVSPSELLMSMFRRKTASVRSRSSVSPSPIAEITETSVNSAEIKLCSETVTTSVLLQDVVWWKLHFTEAASCLKSTLKKTSPGRRRSEDEVSITWVVELDSVQCNFSDSDAFRWTVSVRLLTFSKFQNAKEWEFGAESLLIVDPESNPGPASYEHHRWGHTIYIGVAIVQYIPDLLEPSVYVCVDDFKAEWSDKSLSGREALIGS